MTRTASPFTTIRSEGALLPPELLARIADADKDLGGLAPTDYHLGDNERLGEAIARSWNRLVGVWASFAPSLDGFNPNDPGTGATRERWLTQLFDELRFGRLQVAKAREIEGTDYPISHEWGEVPIHLVGAGVELERRTKGVAGAAKMSPHALVQDYLNRTEALWGIVSNGRELRLLRDNVSFTRQAYLAFDLEAMFSGEVYADFALLWLTCHESRLEPQDDKIEDCWLERWTQVAQTQGTRALNTLRQGVERAISTLGAGFVAHPANAALREDLRSGELATADYYRELLRLIYRLIFLFVAEDRALLHPDGSTEDARSRYADFYSMTRMRRLAERLRGGPHPDLWQSFVFVCARLADDGGCPELGLGFLGSSLFSPGACPHLDGAELANRELLGAVRALAFTEQGRVLRQIDYRNMGSEELGSIYESLLELHPEIHHESGMFTLANAAGNERKTTGSYYTPTSLISALLDTALDPVLDEAAAKPEAEAAILDLKVLDPACGSGHFLVAAAHRIAKRLAAHRTDEPEPSPGAYRAALRQVISRCIFGVDVNPMATELCKVSLWMEAVEPGKPLSFLEHHIVCGNSLLGTTPALLAQGIPDEAFTALEGDDKETVKSLKKRNKEERKGQASLFGEAAHPDLVTPIATQVAALEQAPDDSPAALHAKQHAWDVLEASDQVAHARFIADAWCAAFVIEKTPEAPVLTQGVLMLLERHPEGGDPKLHTAVRDLANRYRFLHPHLTFPQVFHTPDTGDEPEDPEQGWSGGFDVVVGNPPFIDSETLSKSLPALRHFAPVRFSTANGNWDAYVPFIELSIAFLANAGHQALVSPMKVVASDYCVALHKFVLARRLAACLDFSALDLFEDAAVSVVVLSVEKRPAEEHDEAAFTRYLSDGTTVRRWVRIDSLRRLPPGYWCLPLAADDGGLIELISNPTLKTAASLSDGASTGEAYKLKEFVRELSDIPKGAAHFALVNTGTVDPHTSLWGTRDTRYLKASYRQPVVLESDLQRFPRRLMQAEARKVIVAGLSSRLEAVADSGNMLCGKSAVLVIPNSGVCEFAVCAFLNSEIATTLYKALFGYRGFSTTSMAVGPRQLELLPSPPTKLLTRADAPMTLDRMESTRWELSTNRMVPSTLLSAIGMSLAGGDMTGDFSEELRKLADVVSLHVLTIGSQQQ